MEGKGRNWQEQNRHRKVISFRLERKTLTACLLWPLLYFLGASHAAPQSVKHMSPAYCRGTSRDHCPMQVIETLPLEKRESPMICQREKRAFDACFQPFLLFIPMKGPFVFDSMAELSSLFVFRPGTRDSRAETLPYSKGCQDEFLQRTRREMRG